MGERDEVRNGRIDWQYEKCRDWLDRNDGSMTETDDRLKEALREFEIDDRNDGSTAETDDRLKEALLEFKIDYFGKHGTFDSCGQPTGLEDGYTEEYYKARYWFLKERGLELPDVESHR